MNQTKQTTYESIGDPASSEKGTAVRACVGKPQWGLMPLLQIASISTRIQIHNDEDVPSLAELTHFLGWHQARGTYDSAMDILEMGIRYLMGVFECDLYRAFEEVIKVWEYGLAKYSTPEYSARFNWMKGMPWSEAIASAQRHVIAMQRGEALDSESQIHHAAHYVCNAMMLVHFVDYYPEGNDLPCQWYAK